MFTPGMLKILQRAKGWGCIENFTAFANEGGYEALEWNGVVYVLEEVNERKRWVKTPFSTSDFNLEILPSQIEMVRSDL